MEKPSGVCRVGPDDHRPLQALWASSVEATSNESMTAPTAIGASSERPQAVNVAVAITTAAKPIAAYFRVSLLHLLIAIRLSHGYRFPQMRHYRYRIPGSIQNIRNGPKTAKSGSIAAIRRHQWAAWLAHKGNLLESRRQTCYKCMKSEASSDGCNGTRHSGRRRRTICSHKSGGILSGRRTLPRPEKGGEHAGSWLTEAVCGLPRDDTEGSST